MPGDADHGLAVAADLPRTVPPSAQVTPSSFADCQPAPHVTNARALNHDGEPLTPAGLFSPAARSPPAQVPHAEMRRHSGTTVQESGPNPDDSRQFSSPASPPPLGVPLACQSSYVLPAHAEGEQPYRRCRSSGLGHNSPQGSSSVSFLEAFHRRQRQQVSSELKRRDEALHTLNQWRGNTPQGSLRLTARTPAAPPSPPQAASDASTRRQLAGEMVALFSSLSSTKQQQASAACRQTIGQLQQQQGHLGQLIRRLRSSASVPKARGVLVKARSLQLQLQMQQQEHRPCGHHRRLPAPLLLPLPQVSSKNMSQGVQKQQQQCSDPWRRLLRRVRPRRRRASLPPSLRLRKGSAGARSSGSACSDVLLEAARGEGVVPPASATGCDTESAAAAEAAAEFSAAVDRFSSSRNRTASAGWRPPRRVSPSGSPLTVREWAEELMQQAEAACCAAVGAFPEAIHAALVKSLEALSGAFHLHILKTQRRLEVAALLEQRRMRPDLLASRSRLVERAAAAALSGSLEKAVRGPRFSLGPPGAALSVCQARSVSGGSAPGGAACAAEGQHEEEGSLATKQGGTGHSAYGEEDTSLLEAETDCEYLLGRQLLPYERMLLKYRVLRKNGYGRGGGEGPSGSSALGDEDLLETRLVEELLLAVEEGTALPGDLSSGPSEESDVWALWGGDTHSDTAKIEHLLGLVGELQKADRQQRKHVSQKILEQADSMPDEERMLRSFFLNAAPPAAPEELLPQRQGAPAEAGGPPAGGPPETARPEAPSGEASAQSVEPAEGPANASSTGENLYKAHYLLGPWNSSRLYSFPPAQQPRQR
ncbi:uncharacterized protein LOC34617484 [Cyclospora cayetanensis]|uniref:Uncharacterized protein LOC34617484 n=1 Tax=Cyclospora cayetanensis TaxID=88456 RepID=A0A6P6RVQ6_9EIME|nr:uncharacterized protein LOC34617484 [Cyclospora cayetanensis]